MIDLTEFKDWFWCGRCVHWGHNRKTSPGPSGGRKGRKIGRDREKCARYRAEGRREHNKARRAARHARRTS